MVFRQGRLNLQTGRSWLEGPAGPVSSRRIFWGGSRRTASPLHLQPLWRKRLLYWIPLSAHPTPQADPYQNSARNVPPPNGSTAPPKKLKFSIYRPCAAGPAERPPKAIGGQAENRRCLGKSISLPRSGSSLCLTKPLSENS